MAVAIFSISSCSSGKNNNVPISNNLIKEAITDDRIVEKYWKLKILDGQTIEMAENQEREMYFTLKADENRVTGFSGCNTFSGSYALDNVNRIRFTHMASTMKACPDVEVDEPKFLEVFELTDNYTVDGEMLSLNVGRRTPLAVFEVVEVE